MTSFEAYVTRIVDEAPELTQSQIDRIAAIFGPALARVMAPPAPTQPAVRAARRRASRPDVAEAVAA